MERLTPTQKQQIRKIFYTDLVDNKQKEQTLQQKIRKKINVEFTKKKKYAVNDFLQELDREKNLIVLVYADHVMGTKPEHSPYTDILKKKKFTKEMIQFVKKLEEKKESQQLRQRQQSKLTQSKNSEIIITKDPSKKTERNVMIFVSSTVVLTVGLLLTPLMISSKK